MIRRKNIAELELENFRLKKEVDELSSNVVFLTKKLEKITVGNESLPEGCSMGTYCVACEFSRFVIMGRGPYSEKRYYCARGEACKGFLERGKYEEKKND